MLEKNNTQKSEAPTQNALPNSQAVSPCTEQPVGVPCAAPLAPQPLNPWLTVKWQLLSVLASYGIARLYISVCFDGFFFGTRIGWIQDWGYPIFTLLFLLWAEGMLLVREAAGAPRPRKAVRIEAAFWAVCAFGISVTFSLARIFCLTNAAQGWGWLFWHGFAAYAVVCRAGLLTEGTTGPFFLWDALYTGVILPFSQFFLRLRTLWRALCQAVAHHRKWDRKKLWITLLCVAAALPVFFYAAELLMQADSGFAGLLENFSFSFQFSSQIQDQFFWFLLSVPVGAYLYGLVGGCTRCTAPQLQSGKLRKDAQQLRLAPPVAGTLILAAFCLLYLLFFLVQASYLFGAFGGKLPEGFTVAEYARQGFYQLCMILLLNFGLLTALARVSQRPVRSCLPLRGLCMALTGCCLLFSATAFSKLMLYIQCFGFTPRRLLSSWAVIVYAVSSILAFSTLVKPHAAIRKLVWFAAVSFLVLCCIPC